MSKILSILAPATAVAALIGVAVVLSPGKTGEVDAAQQPAEAATPVSVARVESRDMRAWKAFSGRLEAIGRVEVKARVSGQIKSVHFREGALVEKGALLVTIDPEPFEAEVARRAAEVAAAQARLDLARNDLDRGRKMTAISTISQRDLDARDSAVREGEATLDAARAALQTSRLDLGYSQVRAPISGRVGKIEITEGNLVSSGPGAPALVRLVSVDPIYASFDADEGAVARALESLPQAGDRTDNLSAIPVEIEGSGKGELAYVDPSVDAATGSVRLRATFANPGGRLMPGQFARVRLGTAKEEPTLLVSERAVAADQDRKYVLVVGDDNRAVYREVTLGATTDGLKIVVSGLKAGERVVVEGLQKLKPGALVAPEPVAMDTRAPLSKQASAN